MLATLLSLTIFLAVPADSTTAPADTVARAARADSSTRRVVRSFPTVEVRALLHDLRSSETVHPISKTALREYPIDGLADAVALQPGVVAVGEELHVRGGRAGETTVYVDGLAVNEPRLRRAMNVPAMALETVDLVSGAPEAQYGGGLAGVLDLRTIDPTKRVSAAWRWQTDGGYDTRYDRIEARVGAPLRFGLGAVAAVDATFDDTYLPALRTKSQHEVFGLDVGWRADNRMLGFVKLAPVERPQRFSAELLASRRVLEPYDPGWSLDGWTFLPANPKESPIFSPTPLTGYQRWRAADHAGITDEEQIAAQVRVGTGPGLRRASASVGWLRTRAVTSVGGGHEDGILSHRPNYGSALDRDRFYALLGDWPLYRESASDVYTLRADAEQRWKSGSAVASGFGLTYEDVSLFEVDWLPLGKPASEPGIPPPIDSLRAYGAYAPGGWAYVQTRWYNGGLVLNAGLRGEYYTAGPQADRQTLPGSSEAAWSLAPRLGIAYPISVRDVFALAYVRFDQSPGRDYLYDHRTAIGTRQPLGNPALRPATVISWEASVKHLFGPAWATQAALFYRDVFGQIGAVDEAIPEGPINLRYDDQDESHAAGFELSLIHAGGDRRRIEVHYTWMQAWGNESRPGGDPYGPVRAAHTTSIGDRPLSWDRTHTLTASGTWEWDNHLSLAWTSGVASPLPWTPKPRRAPVTDLAVVNDRRLQWTENTNLRAQWAPERLGGLVFGVEVRNVFDSRYNLAATVDGYPNPVINTIFDDYGAYFTETGNSGGAYWSPQRDGNPGHWVPVNDPRLFNPPRTVRASVGARW